MSAQTRRILLVDFYHLSAEKEDASVIIRATEHIRRLHFANPAGYVIPLSRNEYDYEPFLEYLKKIAYEGRISIETSAAGVSFLRAEFSR